MRNLFLIVAICAVTVVAVLFWDAPPELFFLDNKTRVEAMPTADSYMRNTRTRKYDDEGGLAYVLTAETGLYYSTDDPAGAAPARRPGRGGGRQSLAPHREGGPQRRARGYHQSQWRCPRLAGGPGRTQRIFHR